MTFKEVEEIFLSGEKLTKLFYIRKICHSIGANTITENQFYKLINTYDTVFTVDCGGLTKHYYTFKQLEK